MKSDCPEMSEKIERFQTGLKRAGVKVTHQRLEIFRALARSTEHPDAEAVFNAVRKRVPTISLDTVYRTLWLLLDFGLIDTLGAHRNRARFDANLRPHHHFVCVECGLTRDFYGEAYDGLKPPPEVKALGTVDRPQVEFRGVCRRCSKQRKK